MTNLFPVATPVKGREEQKLDQEKNQSIIRAASELVLYLVDTTSSFLLISMLLVSADKIIEKAIHILMKKLTYCK